MYHNGIDSFIKTITTLRGKVIRKFSSIFIFFIFFSPNFTQDQSSFFDAIIRNNTNSVNYMIQHRADVNAKNSQGMTALHLVSDPRLALTLIVNGADINAKNNSGSTPLHWAVSRNLTSITKLLLEFGANVNSVDNKGNTPLHLSISGKEEIMLLLILSDANVNATNQEGSTALVKALLENETNKSKFLTLAGAENIKNNAEISPSILATLEVTPDIKLGLENNSLDPLIKEIFIENYPEAIRLIQVGVEINNYDINGNTPLHWVFRKKNRYLSLLLLNKNADINSLNNNDQTPIDVLIGTQDLNFIIYIQNILKNKTNFIDSATNSTK